MLTCLPQSLCSWDYQIRDAAAGPATVTFNFFTEQGAITLGPGEFTIRKHGPLSGHWTLEQNGQSVAEAYKPNALFRRFELNAIETPLTVQARSPFTRRFEILRDDSRLGNIWPAHLFTRRAFMECTPDIPELAQLFAFWLVVLTWRRQARDNSAAASSH
jgi:hypothetical protein